MEIGIDIGGSHTAIAVLEKNNIIEKNETIYRDFDFNKINLIKYIEEYIIEKVKEFYKKYEIEKIGICFPGIIIDDNKIKAVNLNIENYDLVGNLEKELSNKITIVNDAKAATLAEKKYGCLKKYNSAIFLTLGTGIGGGLIANSESLDTAKPIGLEVGHMLIKKDGLQCKCGKKGCWEKYASMLALKNKLRKYLEITGYKIKELTSIKLQEILIEHEQKEHCLKDMGLEKILDEYVDNLSVGIVNLIDIYNPEVIGIGGSFVYFKDILLNRLENKLKNNSLLINGNKNIKIEIAQLGNDAGIIGSII